MITGIWIIFTLSLGITIISLIMAPSSNSFSGALVGSSDLDLFKVSKERGVKKILKWSMFAFGIILMVASIITRVYI